MVFYDNGVLGLRERRKRLGVFVFAVLFTVLLGTGTAWAAAYTLTNNAGSACVTKTCTMSAIIADSTHSNWTGTSTFGFMPGNGNTVTIPDGYHLTIDQNWTIGASTANNTTSSIYMSKTGIVEVRSGVTLRARGDLLYDVTAASSTALLLDAGSALIFDSSQAASPTTTRYRFGGDGNGYAIRFLFANGTPSSHVTVTSDLTNGALPGQFRSSPVGNGGSQYGGSLTATYTDFSYIGDGTATGQAWQIADPNFGFGFPYFSLQHCTIDHSGPNFQGSGIGTDATFILNYDTFTNSLGSTNIGVGSGGSVGGKYQVTNNVFDKAWGGGTGGCSGGAPQVGGTFSNNFFGGSMCYDPSSTVTDSFIRGLGTPWLIKGDRTNGYYADDVTNHDNPHWSQYDSTRPITVSGFIFDDPDNISADSGEMWTEGTTPTPMVEGFNNNIELPTKTGSSNSELMASTNVVPNATTTIINMLHNTWVGGTQFGMVQMNEGGASKDPVAAVESNLAWSNSGGYSKVSTVQTAAMLTNSVTLADYNSADSHLTQTITCPSCTNQGNGYIGVWTATPGTHDVTASPNFVDVYRNLALWDTKYLGNAAATQWTSSLGVLASGTLVSDSHAGYYNGLTINFRCIASAGCDTSASNSEPNVGVSWRLYWEFASFKDIENATASGTIYTDGAIGCTSGCTAIQAITAWVKKGFIPQSPALWKAGHDGADIGAVDTPMVNHIPPPVMMP